MKASSAALMALGLAALLAVLVATPASAACRTCRDGNTRCCGNGNQCIDTCNKPGADNNNCPGPFGFTSVCSGVNGGRHLSACDQCRDGSKCCGNKQCQYTCNKPGGGPASERCPSPFDFTVSCG